MCIDPVNVLAINLEKDKFVRESVYELVSELKSMGVTSLLSVETTEGSMDGNYLGNDDLRTQMLKFLADAIINLYSSGLGGSTDRAIRIEKMRRVNHARGPKPLKITDKGIVVLK